MKSLKDEAAPSKVNFFPVPGDSFKDWAVFFLNMAVRGRYADPQKIELHLNRFCSYIEERYGHDRITTLTHRDVKGWRDDLYDNGDGYMPSTVNGHLDSLSTFFTWTMDKAIHLFPLGDPAKGIKRIGSLPLKARALSDRQVASLKNTCDRLLWHYSKHDRKRSKMKLKDNVLEVRSRSRPYRDRAMIFTFLSTGLRREEMSQVNLSQVEPNDPELLRKAKIAKLRRVRGKGGNEREVYLSYDARQALADYIELERPRDANYEKTTALFLTAADIPARKPDGRMSVQSINQLMSKIGKLHDANFPDRPISPLQPHSLRHTFAYSLVDEMIRIKGGLDETELERRLGHRSAMYIQIYVHGPEEVSQFYVERL